MFGMENQSKDFAITVEKAKLLSILKSNREKHIAEFEKAKVAYKSFAIGVLRKNIDTIERYNPDGKGKIPVINLKNCNVPTSYEKSYDKAIGMLELSCDEKLVISASLYKRFIDDEWDWKGQFDAVNASYAAQAATIDD